VSWSCLVTKLGHFVDLSERDKALLEALEKDERNFRRNDIVRRAGTPADELFVVRSGWATSLSIMDDGRRQLLKLYFPGDIVDLADAGSVRVPLDVKCVTDAVLCPFPKSGLEPIFTTSPRVMALLFAVTVRETNALTDRIRAIGRFSAYERLCHLLLEIRDRLSVIDERAKSEFRMSLTQLDLADLLGLTNVYVSKTLARIEKDGLIRRQGSRLHILKPAKMREICEYRQPSQLDFTWLPSS
jgi:CRP-like cAMP-binding protein